jgi:hypothetical protein
MPLDVKTLGPSFVAEVSGVDFSKPLDRATLGEVVAAMDRYAVCHLRAVRLYDWPAGASGQITRGGVTFGRSVFRGRGVHVGQNGREH